MRNFDNTSILISLLPLGAFAFTTALYVAKGEAYQVFWLCNVVNLVMFFGLAFGWMAQVWSATILLIIGMPLWLYEDIIVHNTFRWNAFFIHIVSSVAGLYIIRERKIPKYIKTFCVGWLLIGFCMARVFTAEQYNVNMAYFVYPTLQQVFPSFYLYFLFNVTSFIIAIFCLDFVIRRFWVVRQTL